MEKMKASREKYWEELETKEEQIERLRCELKQVKFEARRFFLEMEEIKNHLHMPSGEMVRKVKCELAYGPIREDKYL